MRPEDTLRVIRRSAVERIGSLERGTRSPTAEPQTQEGCAKKIKGGKSLRRRLPKRRVPTAFRRVVFPLPTRRLERGEGATLSGRRLADFLSGDYKPPRADPRYPCTLARCRAIASVSIVR
jgi:hypothetical protein